MGALSSRGLVLFSESLLLSLWPDKNNAVEWESIHACALAGVCHNLGLGFSPPGRTQLHWDGCFHRSGGAFAQAEAVLPRLELCAMHAHWVWQWALPSQEKLEQPLQRDVTSTALVLGSQIPPTKYPLHPDTPGGHQVLELCFFPHPSISFSFLDSY